MVLILHVGMILVDRNTSGISNCNSCLWRMRRVGSRQVACSPYGPSERESWRSLYKIVIELSHDWVLMTAFSHRRSISKDIDFIYWTAPQFLVFLLAFSLSVFFILFLVPAWSIWKISITFPYQPHCPFLSI